MGMMRQWARRFGVLAALLAVAGCSGSGKVDVYEVEGRVMFEGKPMRGGGTIAFVPIGGQVGKAAGGTIDADGNYEMMTYRPGDGSMAGEFRVVIIQVVEREPEPSKDGEAAVNEPSQVVPMADRIPAIYSDPEKSPLRATVKPEDSNKIDFDLKRSAAPPPHRGAMGDWSDRGGRFAALRP